MTRKHYVILAEEIHRAFRQCRSDGERIMITGVAKEMAAAIQKDNSAFKYPRFMRACGVLVEGDK